MRLFHNGLARLECEIKPPWHAWGTYTASNNTTVRTYGLATLNCIHDYVLVASNS